MVPPGLPGSHDRIKVGSTLDLTLIAPSIILRIYIYIYWTCVGSFKCFMLSFIFGFVLMEACLCVGPLKEEAVATAATVVRHCCLVNHR